MPSGIINDVNWVQPENAKYPILFRLFGRINEVKPEQIWFVAHVDNQRVAYNTVEKSCRGRYEGVKSCRFNNFNVI